MSGLVRNGTGTVFYNSVVALYTKTKEIGVSLSLILSDMYLYYYKNYNLELIM